MRDLREEDAFYGRNASDGSVQESQLALRLYRLPTERAYETEDLDVAFEGIIDTDSDRCN